MIRFVVMVTPEDLKANAEYIRMADQYVPVSGGTNNNNYANVELIVDIALRTQAQVQCPLPRLLQFPFPRLQLSLLRLQAVVVSAAVFTATAAIVSAAAATYATYAILASHLHFLWLPRLPAVQPRLALATDNQK